MTSGPADRAVEILRKRGDGRWTVGSGYLAGGRLVLTAAHNVRTGDVLDAGILVRCLDGVELAAAVLLADAATDLAVLEVVDSESEFLSDLPTLRFARVDRARTERIERCWAIGFPLWKEHPGLPAAVPLRDCSQIWGSISPASNRKRGLLELATTATPRPLEAAHEDASQWQGMSGAVVFSDDPEHGPLAIGVLIEHHMPEGASTLTLTPLSGLAGPDGDGRPAEPDGGDEPARSGRNADWWWSLGLDTWTVLPRAGGPPGRPTTRHLALRRPLSDFTDRERLAAKVRTLLTDRLSESSPVVVLYGMPGVGKTALANHIAHQLGPAFPHARILVDLGGAPRRSRRTRP